MTVSHARRQDPTQRKRLRVRLRLQMDVTPADADFILETHHHMTDGVELCIRLMREVVSRAYTELAGFFAPEEWKYIALCLKGLDGLSYSARKVDVAELLSPNSLCRLLKKTQNRAKEQLCGVDRVELAERIRNNLTEIHIYAIRRRVRELYIEPHADLDDWCRF